MRKVIFHYHLFKNAGTSVDAILKTNFPTRWVTQEFNAPHADSLNLVANWISQEENAVAFSSHTAALPPPQLPGLEIFPIIFIRHPIDRIASAYYFEKKQNSDNGSAVLAKNTNLSGYIDAHLAHGRVSQCRNFQSHRLSQFFPGADEDLTGLALQAVEALPFIGLVEAFDESIHCLTHWLLPHFPGFHPMAVAKNVGRTAETLEQKLATIREEIGETRYGQLLAANNADMAVFEAVQNKYANRHINHSVMQFWDNPVLPADIAPLVETWKQKNPTFQHRLFNDVTAREYMAQHFPAIYLAAFDACAIPAMRADFFRYAYIYNEGGIYVDVSFSCLTPVLDWLDLSNEVVLLLKKHVGIITNSFIAAQKGSPLLKAVLDQSVINIHKKSSENLWLVTGPGVIQNTLEDKRLEDSLTLMDFRLFTRNCPPGKDLAHKKEAHWTKRQKQHSIFTQNDLTISSENLNGIMATAANTDANPDSVDVKLLLIGHPNCGSRALVQHFSGIGLRIGHEKLARDGICSWWMTAQKRPDLNGFIRGPKDKRIIVKPELLCHFIRNPLAAIPDIVIENEANQRDNTSFKHRRGVIYSKYQVDIAEHEPLAAALVSYIYWNRLAEESNPDITVRVDNLETDLLPVYQHFGLSPLDGLPKPTTQPRRLDVPSHPKTDPATLLQLVTGDARLSLEHYLSLFFNG